MHTTTGIRCTCASPTQTHTPGCFPQSPALDCVGTVHVMQPRPPRKCLLRVGVLLEGSLVAVLPYRQHTCGQLRAAGLVLLVFHGLSVREVLLWQCFAATKCLAGLPEHLNDLWVHASKLGVLAPPPMQLCRESLSHHQIHPHVQCFAILLFVVGEGFPILERPHGLGLGASFTSVFFVPARARSPCQDAGYQTCLAPACPAPSPNNMFGSGLYQSRTCRLPQKDA